MGCRPKGRKPILPAKNRFATFLGLAALRPQKLALRAQTICAAGAPLRQEPFAQRRFDFASQNRFTALLRRPVQGAASRLFNNAQMQGS
jgi:hypothetical protein